MEFESLLTVPLGVMNKDFFDSLAKNPIKTLEDKMKNVDLVFDEFYSDNINKTIESLNIKAKDGKLDKAEIKFKNGDSFSYKRDRKEVQDALVFIEENK